MTPGLAIGAPLVVAAAGLALRRKVGPWASWLFLLGLIVYIGAYGTGQPVFWNKPAFLASMSEDLGAMLALIAAALLLAEWKHRDVSPGVQWITIALVLIGVQWALARLPLPDLAVKTALVLMFLWLLSQIFRGIRYLVTRARKPPVMSSPKPTDALGGT
jgi:hypothetical protein